MNQVDTYIQQFDPEVQRKLRQIQNLVSTLVPEATERMCMGIPTFDLDEKWLVHYGAFKKHIGFYPDPETIEAFKEPLKGYKCTKGTVQFPLDKPLDLDLISRMIRFRAVSLKK